MIKLEAAHIEEMRGIRNLDIAPSRKTFAISGPNGSGKSGVIDAIAFGLTGEIKRLTGSGTKGLSVALYDFVSTIPYIDDSKAALSCSRTKRFDAFSEDDLSHLAAKAQLPEKLVLDTARETVALFHEHWRA